MELQKLSFASEETVDALISKACKVLQNKQKSQKDVGDALKLLLQIVTLKGASSLEIPNEAIVSIFFLIDDEACGIKNRFLAVAILGAVIEGGMPILQEDVSRYKDKITSILLRKLLLTSGDQKAFAANGTHLLSPLLSPSPLRSTSFPLMLSLFRKYTTFSLRKQKRLTIDATSRSNSTTALSGNTTATEEEAIFCHGTPLGWLDNATLISFTQNLEAILLRTPTQAARDPNATNLFSVLSSSAKPTGQVLNDVDGQATRSFFTPLLDFAYLSDDQISHHTLLMTLENILTQLYSPIMDLERARTNTNFAGAFSALLDSIYKYIARVMDQIKYCQQLELKALTGVQSAETNAFFQVPTTESKEMREARITRGLKYPDLLQTICLRLLAVLCRLEPTRVEVCWQMLVRSCLAMSGVETNLFSESSKSGAKEGEGSAKGEEMFSQGARASTGATYLSNWHASVGVPAGLILGFSSAFFYPATCSALFFAPASLLSFGTSPERLHATSALAVLSFILDSVVFSTQYYGTFVANRGILPFGLEFLFRSYFDSFLSLYYQDPVIAFDTFTWLQKYATKLNGGTLDANNKFCPPLRLSTHINMFGQHLTFFECFYKILVKLYAWHGMPLKAIFEQSILHAAVTPYIHLELLHTLIDLPLLTCSMEMVETEVKAIILATPTAGFNALAAASSHLTSVVFSVHLQSQQVQAQQPQNYLAAQLAMSDAAAGQVPHYPSSYSSAPNTPLGSFKSASSTSMAYSGMGQADGYAQTAMQFQPPCAPSNQPSLMSPTGIYIDRHRSILNMLLWNEGGVIGNLWESSSGKRSSSSSSHGSMSHIGLSNDYPLASFWNDCKITPRALAACENAISCSERLLKIVIQQVTYEQMREIVVNLFDRMEKSFPLNTFQAGLQMMLINSLAACFEKYPILIVDMQKLILDFLSDSDAAAMMAKPTPLTFSSSGATWRDELSMCLVWMIGKYASNELAGDTCTYQVLLDYDEALELLAYEKMSLLSMEATELKYLQSKSAINDPSSTRTPTNWKKYQKSKKQKIAAPVSARPNVASASPTARLLLVLSSSLTKLAARCLPLASRVKLCLAKILRHPPSQAPPEVVLEWAHHCLNILKYPSLAAHLMEGANMSDTSPALSPWTPADSQMANSLQHIQHAENKELAVDDRPLETKNFDDPPNPSIDLSSSSAFKTDAKTSLSFLLHQVDNNIVMGHDGRMDAIFEDISFARHYLKRPEMQAEKRIERESRRLAQSSGVQRMERGAEVDDFPVSALPSSWALQAPSIELAQTQPKDVLESQANVSRFSCT